MLEQAQHIFIVGIKGVAMANLARILSQMGKNVTGSDMEEEFITDSALREAGINVIHSFSAEALPEETDLVIYAAAHGGLQNPQIIEAQNRRIKIVHQSEVLAELLKEFKTSIAVCGCHGKTTTSSLLAYALKNLGAKPSYMVGVSTFVGMGLTHSLSVARNDEHFGGEYASKDYFVVEADEYGLNPPYDKTPKLNLLYPTHAICTNIDFDHPDVYKDLEETKDVFLKFFHASRLSAKPPRGTRHASNLFFCADDENLMSVAKQLPKDSYQTFGFAEESDLRILDVKNDEEETSFTIQRHYEDPPAGGDEVISTGLPRSLSVARNDELTFQISLFGEKNVSNAVGIIAFLLSQGFQATQIQQAIQGFAGAKRRFEKVAFVNNTYLFDDYAHHPHEISTTIQAARARFPNRRIIILFQPHTCSRTESLKNEFIQHLAKADVALIAPIFASAREKATGHNISSIHLAHLAKQQGITNIEGFESKEDLMATFQQQVKRGDVVFTMGAGDIYKLSDKIKTLL